MNKKSCFSNFCFQKRRKKCRSFDVNCGHAAAVAVAAADGGQKKNLSNVKKVVVLKKKKAPLLERLNELNLPLLQYSSFFLSHSPYSLFSKGNHQIAKIPTSFLFMFKKQ